MNSPPTPSPIWHQHHGTYHQVICRLRSPYRQGNPPPPSVWAAPAPLPTPHHGTYRQVICRLRSPYRQGNPPPPSVWAAPAPQSLPASGIGTSRSTPYCHHSLQPCTSGAITVYTTRLKMYTYCNRISECANFIYLRIEVHFFVCIGKWKDTGHV